MHRTAVSLMILAACLGAANSASLAQNPTAAKSTAPIAEPSSAPAAAKPSPSAAKPEPDWIARSNHYTQMLLEVQLKHSPESASTLGLTSFDTAITDASRADEIAQRKQLEDVLATLKKAEAKEQDKNMRQDLEILQSFYNLQFRREDYPLNHKVQFVDASLAISGGLRTLLDDKVAAARRPAAVIRLRKYAGVEPGFKPFTEVLQQRMIEQMGKPGMVYPSTPEIESQFAQDKSTIDSLGALFVKYKLTGWQEPFAKLQEQLADYETWIRATVLPKASASTRPTPEEVALNLESYGINLPPERLVSEARAAFADHQKEMAPLAAEVAKQHGWTSSDYRDVIRNLKKTQITGDAILPFYQARLKAIDEIVVAKNLVTLPATPATLRLATAEETAHSPAPHLVPLQKPRENGQRSEFILPLNNPSEGKDAPSGGKDATEKFDDFTFDAVAWPTIARELRPGNELELNFIAQHGISLARKKYAFNATDVDRWGLYSEWLLQPYEPADGQLITLQLRLLRAASVFLDSDLQSGKITPDDATKLLEKDVVLSPACAKAELDSLASLQSGQTDGSFYGYITLLQLRKDTESALGRKFDAKQFNDFVLAQGLLPSDLLRKAVLEDFVPSQKKKK